ncbi:hypothetical protein D3C81_2290180 [compost metagenome]
MQLVKQSLFTKAKLLMCRYFRRMRNLQLLVARRIDGALLLIGRLLAFQTGALTGDRRLRFVGQTLS